MGRIVPLSTQSIDDVTPTDGVVLVGDGTKFVGESGATARSSIGLGTTDTAQFAGGGFGRAPVSGWSLAAQGSSQQFRAGTTDTEYMFVNVFGSGSTTVSAWNSANSSGSAEHTMTFWRSTNTSGVVRLIGYRGNNTSTNDWQIGSGSTDTNFCKGGGNFGIGSATDTSADFWVDTAGNTRIGGAAAVSSGGGKSLVLANQAADTTPAASTAALWLNGTKPKIAVASGAAWCIDTGFAYTSVKNSAYTAIANEFVLCNASTASATFAVTLPSSAVVGDRVGVALVVDDRATAVASRKTVTINRNGHLVDGSTDTEKWRLCLENEFCIFEYVGQDVGWIVYDGCKPIVYTARRITTTTGTPLTDTTYSLATFDTVVKDTHGVDSSYNFYSLRGGLYSPTGLSTVSFTNAGRLLVSRIAFGDSISVGVYDFSVAGQQATSVTGFTRTSVSGPAIDVPQAKVAWVELYQGDGADRDLFGSSQNYNTFMTIAEIR